MLAGRSAPRPRATFVPHELKNIPVRQAGDSSRSGRSTPVRHDLLKEDSPVLGRMKHECAEQLGAVRPGTFTVGELNQCVETLGERGWQVPADRLRWNVGK